MGRNERVCLWLTELTLILTLENKGVYYSSRVTFGAPAMQAVTVTKHIKVT
jgi:hypothetical protein